MTTLAISGSRSATPQMIRYAWHVVQRAAQRGLIVATGDNPRGVDRTIAEACRFYGVRHLVYGIDPEPRFGDYGQYTQLTDWSYTEPGIIPPGHSETDFIKPIGPVKRRDLFHARDRHLIDTTDWFMAIWDGVSEDSGTYRAYRYAESKPAASLNRWLVQPVEGQMQITKCSILRVSMR